MAITGRKNQLLERVSRMVFNKSTSLNRLEKTVLTAVLVSTLLFTAAFTNTAKPIAQASLKTIRNSITTITSITRQDTTKKRAIKLEHLRLQQKQAAEDARAVREQARFASENARRTNDEARAAQEQARVAQEQARVEKESSSTSEAYVRYSKEMERYSAEMERYSQLSAAASTKYAAASPRFNPLRLLSKGLL